MGELLMKHTSGLLIVDVQVDFCSRGALAVPDGDAVVAVLNEYAELFAGNDRPVVASRDWHPRESTHFKEHGGPWPVHCVANTDGARFHPDLRLPPSAVILSKGLAVDADGYSAFEGTDDARRSLLSILREHSVERLFVGGLATDYCVKASVLDALEHGLIVYLLEDAIRGVDVNSGDSEKALEEMSEKGARLIRLREVRKLIAGS
jgi:nicotinamidase/pyrazinamidase